MSNVHHLLPPLTISRRFVKDFIEEDAPCFALCMVEDRGQTFAALVLRPGVVIPPSISEQGFELGHALYGGDDFEVIHFAFEFRGFETYNVVLNPCNPLVQAVVRSMVERGGYFILAVGPDHSVTTFRAGFGETELSGLTSNLQRIQGSTTTKAQYRKAETQFRRRPDPPGQMLNWVCRDDTSYLDPAADPLEMSPRPREEKAADNTAEPSRPLPRWHPLSMLPTIGMIIDGELESTEDLRGSMLAARDRRHLLDDETVQRSIRLCTNQMEFVPINREQLARWLAASPSRAQRNEIKRLASQLDRHEAVIQEVLALAKEMASGTIDAILGMGEGELGLAMLEGRIKPPSGAPLNEDLGLREQRAIAELLDARVEELEQAGVNDIQLLAQMQPQLPLFHRLMEIAGHDGLSALLGEYRGLYRFAMLLQRIAVGIQTGRIKVPR